MNAAPGQQHFNPDSRGQRSRPVQVNRLALSLSLIVTVASLVMAAPGFGQSLPHPPEPTTSQSQMVPRSLARGLVWTLYLGIPIALMVMTQRRESEERERLAKLVEHMATLERIWQHSPTQ